MYKVIQYFTDLQDFNHPYKVGDVFPRLGMKVSEARLKELSGKNNKQGKPLIKLVEKKKEEITELPFVEVPNNATEYTKTEINRMPLADLKVLAKENGLDDDRSGAELKKALIEWFNL